LTDNETAEYHNVAARLWKAERQDLNSNQMPSLIGMLLARDFQAAETRRRAAGSCA
jgi:hypothetical protein